MAMSLVLHLPREIHFCRSSSNVQRLPSFLDMLQNPHVFAHFCQGGESLAPVTQNDASTPKSGTNMCCFVLFDFEMCFAPQRRTLFEHLNFQNALNVVCFVRAPQRRALFRHLNFQKCSERGVLGTF